MNIKGTKITLLIASTLTTMSSAAVAPSLPQIATDFSYLPNAELLSKLVLTIPALLIAFSAPFAGHWVDKRGRLKLFIAGLVLYGITGTSGFFLNDLYLILLGRALLGVSVGILMTVVTTLIGDYFEGKSRQQLMGLKAACVSIGGMLFVGAGGFLADLNWRYPFLLYGFSFIVLLLVLQYLQEPVADVQKRSKETSNVTSKNLILVFATAFTAMMLFYLIPVQLPFQMKVLGIEKSSVTGGSLALNTLAIALGSLLFSRLKHRFTFSSLFAIGLGLMGVGYAFIWQAVDMVLIAAGMIFSGFGMGLILPGLGLWMLELSSAAGRGRNSGILTTCMFLGAFASPIVVQPIVNATDLGATFGVVAVFSILLSMIFVGARVIVVKKTR